MKDEEIKEKYMNILTKRLITFCIALLVCAVESFGDIVTVSVDDFAGLSTAASSTDLAITKSENGLELKFGTGTSSLGRDAYGTGTSTFGQSGAWFDVVMQNLEILQISNSLISGLQTIPAMTRNSLI